MLCGTQARRLLSGRASDHLPNGVTRCGEDGSHVLKVVIRMAKTKEGKKIVPVKPYTREVNGKKVPVKRHDRSTPN